MLSSSCKKENLLSLLWFGLNVLKVETWTYLWLYRPRRVTSFYNFLSSVNISRKHRDLVVDVVQRHKPPSIPKKLANNFVSLAGDDLPVLQDSRDLRRTLVLEKFLAVRDWIHHFSSGGNEDEEEEEEGSDHSWVRPSCLERCQIQLYQLIID